MNLVLFLDDFFDCLSCQRVQIIEYAFLAHFVGLYLFLFVSQNLYKLNLRVVKYNVHSEKDREEAVAVVQEQEVEDAFGEIHDEQGQHG